MPSQKIAFYVGLTKNFGPVSEHTDIIFDRVITNIGASYEPHTGRFTAPINGVYQFNVIVSAQGRHKVYYHMFRSSEKPLLCVRMLPFAIHQLLCYYVTLGS